MSTAAVRSDYCRQWTVGNGCTVDQVPGKVTGGGGDGGIIDAAGQVGMVMGGKEPALLKGSRDLGFGTLGRGLGGSEALAVVSIARYTVWDV